MHGAGDMLAHYRLEEKRADRYETWKAVDTRSGRAVDLRLLDSPADAAHMDRLRRSVETIARIDHPGIVKIDEVGEADGVQFVCSGAVEGRALAGCIAGGLEPGRIKRLALATVDALRAAHEQGLVHGSLSPHAILLAGDDDVRLVDLGVADVTGTRYDPAVDQDSVPTQTLSQDELGQGTLLYMSPEQVQGKPLDPRADLFSFGSILHEMATGKPAFSGESPADVFVSILRDEPVPASSLSPAGPAGLDAVIGRCLAKLRSERYRDAAELHEALRAL